MAAPNPAENKVTLQTDNKQGPVPAYLFESPVGKQQKVGIVVIQEWWGINNEIKGKAAKFAGKNISAIVPDLYRGKTATTDQEASHLMSGLDWAGAVLDIKAAMAHLKSLGYQKIFVTGYCMGGALALASSVLNGAELSGGIVYYGIPDKKLGDPVNLKVPLQCHFGKLDNYPGFSDQKAALALEATLKAINAKHEFYHYDGCKHAFTKTDGPNYSAADAATAFDRTVAFVQKYSS